MHALPQHANPTRLVYAPARMPSRRVEYVYYFALIYSVMAEVLGISVALVGGGLVLALSVYCILELRSCAWKVYAPIAWLVACAISFLSVQTIIHGQSIIGGETRPYITWILGLIIVHSLCLRPGFTHRFTVFLFVLGVTTLPFLAFTEVGVERARVGLEVGGSLSHPGGLSEWFGFCAVYFAIFGLENDRLRVRVIAWVVAVGCLFIVTLTVGRGSLFASAIAITVGFRAVLKRGFVPLLLLFIMSLVIYESGLFERVAAPYIERGMEETGREILWPAAIERIFASPLTTLLGVGMSNTGLYVLSHKWPNPPHNSFLYFALSSGVVPLAFYVAFWIQAAWKSFWHAERLKDGSFRIPFLLFTFVEVMLGDSAFMSFWALLALSVAAGRGTSYRTDRLLVIDRIRGRQTARLLGRRSKAASPIERHRF